VEAAPDELDPDVRCSFRDDATPLNVGGFRSEHWERRLPLTGPLKIFGVERNQCH
jgi:hypothetical protein